MDTKLDKKYAVVLQSCEDYDRDTLKGKVARAFQVAGFKVTPGTTLLLKPNLVAAGSRPGHLACSSPAFVAIVAEWCLDHGARVKVGDSPAFGSARMVMAASGMTDKLEHLGVELVNFSSFRPTETSSGWNVKIATAALDCDVLVNLPRVKAHNQLYVSLAVKNYFGVVVGWRKALHHAINGEVANRFEELLVDLVGLFPGSFTLLDGIIAMHRTGPIKGEAFPLGLVGASFDPVALDTAVMVIMGADPDRSIIWQECCRRRLAGTELAEIPFPLKSPDDFSPEGFVLPAKLSPVTFHPGRMLVGGCRRLAAGIFRE